MSGLGDMMSMMRNLGDLQGKLQTVQEELRRKTVEGSAGGGMVTAKVNGRLELLDIAIDPEVAGEDVDLLEDMVKAAVGQAMDKARELRREGMSQLLGGRPLPPGLGTLLGQ
jgi:hypothetical protein